MRTFWVNKYETDITVKWWINDKYYRKRYMGTLDDDKILLQTLLLY